MSLYSELFGKNKFSGDLLAMVGLKEDDIPRFRDCYLKDSITLVVHTRTGGGNREAYEAQNDLLAENANYIFDWDDDFDPTYANFEYRVPEAFQKITATLLSSEGTSKPPSQRWKDLFQAMKTNKKDDPEVEKVKSVLAR